METPLRAGGAAEVKDSTIGISIAPPDGDFDVKFAVELGAMIMLDKPIILVAKPGEVIARKLLLVADRVVYADITTDEGQATFMEALKEEGLGQAG